MRAAFDSSVSILDAPAVVTCALHFSHPVHLVYPVKCLLFGSLELSRKTGQDERDEQDGRSLCRAALALTLSTHHAARPSYFTRFGFCSALIIAEL